MCGIVGYVGGRKAQPVLLESLQRVLYRGYDSFGLAVLNGSGIQVHRDVGTVEDAATAVPDLQGQAGIAHTRWATVGKVCRENAHPHLDCDGDLAIVHNGDIDNYHVLKRRLQCKGHVFRSETDSEVIAHLIEEQGTRDLAEAVTLAVEQLEGVYAVLALRADKKELVVARRHCPLVVGTGEAECFVASDVPAILPYTNKVVYLEDGDVAHLTPDGISVWQKGHPVSRKVHQVDWSPDQLSRCGHEHFMIKEIHEQPQALRDTLVAHVSPSGEVRLNGGRVPRSVSSVLLLGCGTSYHACLMGEQVMERVVGVPLKVRIASEYLNGHPVRQGALAVALSQSGETADTRSALRLAKDAGYTSVAVTNVFGSSISREADEVLYTKAGPEVAVASTKTFLAQVVVLYLLGLYLDGRGRANGLEQGLRALPNLVHRVLNDAKQAEKLGSWLAAYKDLFIIARGLNLPIALEGALKFKEIPYLHAEGCAAGELKHGPFALLGPDTPVIAIVSPDEHRARMLTAMREIKARFSPIIAIAPADDADAKAFSDMFIPVPQADPLVLPLLNVVVLQLLSYYCARARGCPIDRPRNLAKSVTVP